MNTLPLYRAGVPDLPGHHAPVSAYAFTARPDIWPPGTQGGFRGPPWAWWYYSRGPAEHRAADAVRAGRHLPGQAEAAILAGQVTSTLTNLDWRAE